MYELIPKLIQAVTEGLQSAVLRKIEALNHGPSSLASDEKRIQSLPPCVAVRMAPKDVQLVQPFWTGVNCMIEAEYD